MGAAAREQGHDGPAPGVVPGEPRKRRWRLGGPGDSQLIVSLYVAGPSGSIPLFNFHPSSLPLLPATAALNTPFPTSFFLSSSTFLLTIGHTGRNPQG